MTLLGTGLMPSGAIGTELTAVTRRAFIPRFIVQIYQASPLLAALLQNAQMASGGVSSVTVPVQGQAFVNAQMSDYSGGFNQPSVQQGAFEADFNLALMITPIPFLGMEGAVQINAAVIPLIDARMNDSGNASADLLATKLWNSAGVNSSIDITSLGDTVGNTGTYGNLSRVTNTWWQSGVGSVGGSPNPTRATILQFIVAATKKNGGEMPTLGVCGPGTWTALAQDFVAQEVYALSPGEGFDQAAGGVRSLFTALVVAGVPIYLDPYAPEGLFYFINDRYFSVFMHEDAAFAFTGFASTLPNMQLGYIGALVAVLQTVLVKAKAATVVSGFGSVNVTV